MHLTDEQLNEYLDGETTGRILIEAHLASCADCAARLAAFQALFAEIESLPDVDLPHSITARLSPSRLPAPLPRSLRLTVILQAALALTAMIVAAPFIAEFASPFLARVQPPTLLELWFIVEAQWTAWLHMLSALHLPSLPQLPAFELSSLVLALSLAGASVIWLVGNGLLLKKRP